MTSPTTLLTIEDDANVRRTMCSYLADSGFAVLEAVDAAEGLDLFRRERPALVLTDLRLPSTDGLGVIATLQAESPETPVIVVSGSGWIEDAVEAIRRGAWDYVTKPIPDLAVLEIVVRRALERARLLHENRAHQAQLEEMVQSRTAELQAATTELRAAHIELKEAYVRLQATLQAIPDSLFEVDQAGRIYDCYAPAQAALAAPPESVVGKTFANVWPAPAANAVREALAEAAEKGWHRGAVCSVESPAGQRWYELSIAVKGARPDQLSRPEGRFLLLARDITERKRVETALQESEARFRTLIEQAPVALSVSRNGLGLYANQKLIEMFGLPGIEESVGRPIAEYFAPQFQGESQERIRRRSEGLPVPAEFESMGLRLDGSPFPVQVAVAQVQLSDGMAAVAFVTDITERKRAEENLRRSEEQYRSIFENAFEGLYQSTPQGRFLSVNPASVKMFGYASAEDIINAVTDIARQVYAHPEDREAILELLAQNGSVENFEVECRRKDGQAIWVLLNMHAVRDADGAIRYYEGGTLDITERRQMQQRLTERSQELSDLVAQLEEEVTERQRVAQSLRQSQTTLTSVIESTDDLIWAVDCDFKLTVYNAALNRIFEQSFGTHAFVGAEVDDLLPPERAARFPPMYTRALKEGPFQLEYTTVIGRIFELNLQPMVKDGEPIGVSVFGKDITERVRAEQARQHADERIQAQYQQLQAQHEELVAQEKLVREAEAELRQMNAELEQRVAARTEELSLANAALARAARMKDEFLAGMSHELRTPLTGILGLSEVMQLDVEEPLSERQRTSLGNIHASGEHLLALINDILDLSKVEAGKVELNLAPVPLDEVCEASLRMIRETAARKHLRVTYLREPAVAVLQADERRLKQMLVNLLSNAVKFTSESGAIGLEVAGDAERREVRFGVWDTGIGITPEDQARLFQPFVQLGSHLSRQYTGTGLGLALVARLAELHGGRVEVESDGVPGKGSRFTVVLPWQAAPEPVEAGPGDAAAPRALIVEDSPLQAEQLRRSLADLGYAGAIYSQGGGVLEKAAADLPDVILLDLLLPDRAGWEVLAELKRDPRTRLIPVIVASVLEEQPRAAAMGADACLVKPVALFDLQQALDQARVRPATVGEAKPAEGTAAPKPLILLADDNELNTTVLQRLLWAAGYPETATARNGREALKLIRAWRPALVLMDIQMPEMNGLEAIRALRADADAELAATPVIALTALAMVGDRERCLAAGADDYLTKPVRAADLKQKLNHWLGRVRRSREDHT